MNVIACNPQKGRLETITANFTDDNTTWFDGTGNVLTNSDLFI